MMVTLKYVFLSFIYEKKNKIFKMSLNKCLRSANTTCNNKDVTM